MAAAGPHDFCHEKPQRVPPTACRAHAHRPSTDNRGMRVLVDTGVLLCGCLLLALIVGQAGTATVIWLIAAVTIAGLSMSTDQRQWGIAAPAAYLLVGALSTDSVTGAPLVVYVLARLGALTIRRARMAAVAACVPFVAVIAARVWDTPVLALALVFCALAALLALRTVQEEAARRSLHAVRDDLREKVLTLQDTNAQLLQAQDYELRAAALAERTRIAREIHDGVGHLLTRLLLQVKALQVVHREEPGVVADLTTLDGGLDEALDSMRRSVHALSDDGEELATSLNLLGSRCGIDSVRVDCSTEAEPPAAVARCVVAVVREALTNAARHGGARSARVAVTDYPAFWQVTVDNDGVVPAEGEPAVDGRGGSGLGLRSMTD
ncbi:two-component sensor histidine kinase, partial [Candidatus Saccharibacteria bacterium]|nr:two-component sensor histidine kinase [Candidatus Saccharibacteria bacterium]